MQAVVDRSWGVLWGEIDGRRRCSRRYGVVRPGGWRVSCVLRGGYGVSSFLTWGDGGGVRPFGVRAERGATRFTCSGCRGEPVAWFF